MGFCDVASASRRFSQQSRSKGIPLGDAGVHLWLAILLEQVTWRRPPCPPLPPTPPTHPPRLILSDPFFLFLSLSTPSLSRCRPTHARQLSPMSFLRRVEATQFRGACFHNYRDCRCVALTRHSCST